MVYHSQFHYLITYGLLLWDHTTEVTEISKLQKRAMRMIYCRAHYKPLFAQLGINTVFGQYVLLCLMHIKERINDLATHGMVHNHNTRQRHRLDVPRVRLAGTSVGHQIQPLRLYNKLPDEFNTFNETHFKVPDVHPFNR